jgi:hypothetical protein
MKPDRSARNGSTFLQPDASLDLTKRHPANVASNNRGIVGNAAVHRLRRTVSHIKIV